MGPVKIVILSLLAMLALRGCFVEMDEPVEPLASEPPFDPNAYFEEMETGVGETAIRAEIGRFILLRRDGADVALKLMEHTRPSRRDMGMLGARYVCFVFEDDDYSHFKKYVGEVYEREGGGFFRFRHVYVKCGTFKIEWSMGDWIYFGDSISAMARTDKTDIEDVDFADETLEWHHRE